MEQSRPPGWRKHEGVDYDDGTLRRFHAGVERRGEDECWPWSRSTTSNGYGQITRTRTPATKHQVLGTHRLAYELAVGPIPDGFVVDHTCHNRDSGCPGGATCEHRRCCNPSHLEAVPIPVNVGRMPERSRLALGALNRLKTHCPKGHPYDAANTYEVTRSSGLRYRQCRECRRANAALQRARRRSAEG